MNRMMQLKTITRSLLITLALLCFGLVPRVQAVVPPPDGGYPNFTTAEGQNALFSLTSGAGNTAVGWFSLFSNSEGSFNTATGVGTLLFNTADENTAFGAAALLFNTTGSQNTANGTSALFSNISGSANTATGVEALLSNTTGEGNTANGAYALDSNSTGNVNTAIGDQALYSNTTGNDNTANGFGALEENTAGNANTAIGVSALFNNTTGNSNTAIGESAGSAITSDGNVCIGAGITGVAGESNITRIRNIYESAATERAVYVTSDNRIGTLSSSRRYKEEITPMENASEAIHSLRPVTFRYKKEVDPKHSLSFGLIAEEVAKVNPDLVTPDHEGKPETVRYEAVNAMLLNEFLKEHRTVEELKQEVAALTATVKQQAEQLKKVSAGLEIGEIAVNVARNNQ